MAAFGQQLGLGPQLTSGLLEQGWLIPTPVQQECIPLVLGGGDVLAAAETGSGKTAAFALPVVQSVQEDLLRGLKEPAFVPRKRKKPKKVEDADGNSRCVLNPEDRDALLAISKESGNLVCQSRGERAWAGCRATKGARSGRY